MADRSPRIPRKRPRCGGFRRAVRSGGDTLRERPASPAKLRESANAATIGRTVFRAPPRSGRRATRQACAAVSGGPGKAACPTSLLISQAEIAALRGSESICGAAICRIACFGVVIDYSFQEGPLAVRSLVSNIGPAGLLAAPLQPSAGLLTPTRFGDPSRDEGHLGLRG